MACLDTSLLIDLLGRGGKRRRDRAVKVIREIVARNEELTTTRFNVAELWIGIKRSDNPRREQDLVDTLLAPLTILEFDASSARIFGRLMATLQAAGTPIGDMDALIAAVSLANGQSLVTANPKHFVHVAHLDIITY